MAQARRAGEPLPSARGNPRGENQEDVGAQGRNPDGEEIKEGYDAEGDEMLEGSAENNQLL